MTSDVDSASTKPKKPSVAFAAATSFGVGYLPKAPGTFGSIVGIFIAVALALAWRFVFFYASELVEHGCNPDCFVEWIERHSLFGLGADFWLLVLPLVLFSIFLAAIGTWSASKVAAYDRITDPQHVVIDEVSGQHLTYFLGLLPSLPHYSQGAVLFGWGSNFVYNLLNWKCLLLGFILFRIFDIWKPFPARQLERLPGGWGIMADDWMAGIYAAIVLRVALHFRVL
jgi:phosphatidylglycerophosphatase A